MDEHFVKAMAKLDDGFALADKIVAATRGGPGRAELSDMIETAAGDANLAMAVITRLATYVRGSTPEQMLEAMQAAGIPAILETEELASPAGIILPR